VTGLQPDLIRPPVVADRDPVAATIVGAIDQQTANTGGAHLPEGDLLVGGSPTSTPASASAASSVPGARELRFDALVGSPLPAQFTAMGYIVEKTGTSERILAHEVAQRFETSSSGALVPATEGSTKPVTVTVTNAGIAAVDFGRQTCGAASRC
jgi:hypothetical protein